MHTWRKVSCCLVAGVGLSVAVVLPRTAEADACLSLPTTKLGATSVKGDGVTFNTKFSSVQSALSVSFWVKNPTVRSVNGNINYGYVVGNGGYSARRGFAVGYQEETVNDVVSRGFHLQVKDDTAGSSDAKTYFTQCVVSCNDIRDGRWHHIAIVYDATNQRIVGYYDGVAQVGSRTTWPTSAISDGNINTLSIGRNAENNGWGFGGELAELSLWNCALSDEQVASILMAPIDNPQSQTGLLGYWKLDEGTGSTVADATGHGNTGTVKTAAGADCTTYWGNDFTKYEAIVEAQVTGYVGVEDGESHVCSCTVIRPADGYTIKWAWNDDLEDFTHDEAESFSAIGTYTNRCRVTCEGYTPYTGEATVVIRPTLYVATTGDDAAAGTKDAPLLTITEAIERLGAAGGRILLNDGTYMLEKKFNTWSYNETTYTCGWCVQVCAPIEIIGLSHDPKKVVLDAQNVQCALMAMNHPGASIRYLTLQNAYATEKGPAGSYGGGNLRLDAGTVSDCIFRDGQTNGQGGNLWVSAGAWRVSRCVFYGGRCTSGRAASVFAIGQSDNVYPIVENCFIYGAGVGGGHGDYENFCAATSRGGARFVNCTIAGSSVFGGAAYLYDTNSRFVNCAIYDNDGKDVFNPGARFVCCATATAISKGTNCKVFAEPKFKNAADGNYRLLPGSPLIGAGDLAVYLASAESETDVAGNKRIRRKGISIGCYEYVSGLMIRID